MFGKNLLLGEMAVLLAIVLPFFPTTNSRNQCEPFLALREKKGVRDAAPSCLALPDNRLRNILGNLRLCVNSRRFPVDDHYDGAHYSCGTICTGSSVGMGIQQ